ncbi:TAP-like protein-domain-containing protein [Clohesyomyces aquaticus]|uniref:TAP-like protein-domain-containing protein n=1 Tax=Clohesyomyces aquaticus TaxID=1231657 RepID=A0A1Y1YMH7_9PLEO|nr:TAP-like protein-domain-containing protein [Clohesyomyces aquaticus]
MTLKQTPSCTRLLLSLVTFSSSALSIPISTYATPNGISWGNCSSELGLPPALQCATFSVPVNWDKPFGDHFNLGLVRLPRPSNSTGKRIGHLFVNPGGPGGSAIRIVARIATGRWSVSSELKGSFDFIGVDPRGVGLSSAVNCSADIWNERVSQFPKTQEEYDQLVDHNRRLGESCLNLTGDIVNYLDTISAVKDHEAVRVALGEKLNYLGLSYGTQLGSQYAQLFPDNIRVMVLDGMLQHSQTESSNVLIESTAYAYELDQAFKWAENNETSPLKGRDVEKLWYDLLKNATTKPIPAPGCDDISCRKDVNEEEIRLNAQGFVISASAAARALFADALFQASEGNATLLSTPLTSQEDIGLYPGIAIGCQDWSAYTSSFPGMQAKMRIGEVFAPLNKGACQSWTLQASCAGWPAPLSNPPAKLNVKTRDPILMVNANGDPSTSYVWAVGMLEEIKNQVLLTRNGHGHTSWLLGGNTTKAIDHFLITKELPEAGTVFDS